MGKHDIPRYPETAEAACLRARQTVGLPAQRCKQDLLLGGHVHFRVIFCVSTPLAS